MNSVVITGPTGAIGIALIDRLIDAGYYIYAVVRPDSNRISNIPIHPKVEIVKLDLSELSKLKKIIKYKCSIFYHLGWDGTVGPDRNDMYLQNKNIQYSIDAVNTAHSIGCDTFVGVGSQAEYGRVSCKLSGNTPVNPETGYGIAKYCAGRMTKYIAESYGMRHIWARVLSVYGPYDGKNSMIMSSISKMMKGEYVKFTKGEQMWDYIYSSDAANALYLLGEKGVSGKCYCIGSGKAKPLSEYIHILKNVVNPDADIQMGAVPYSENQVMYLCADISDLVNDVGFEPIVSFEDGIKKIIKTNFEPKSILFT